MKLRGGAFRRNVVWQLIGSAAQALLGALVLLLLGRILKAQGFGEFSIIMGLVYVVNALLEPRMQDVAAKQFWNLNDATDLAGHKRQLIGLLSIELAGKLVPCLGLATLSPLLVRWTSLPAGSEGLIVLAAFGTYISKLGNGLALGFLRVMGRSDLMAYCATGELALRLALMLAYTAVGQLSVGLALLIMVLAGTISNLAQWAFIFRRLGGLMESVRGWTFSSACESFLVSRRLLFANLGLSISDLMNKDLDVTIMAIVLPASQVGIYKMAKNVAQIAWKAIDPFYLALMPEVSRLVALHHIKALRRLFMLTFSGLLVFSILLSIGGYVGLLLFGDAILGTAFREAPALVPWMMAGIVISAPLVWAHPLAVAVDRADIAVAGSLIGGAIGFVSLVILTPLFGIRGAAISWSLSFLTHFVYTAIVALRALDGRIARSAGQAQG